MGNAQAVSETRLVSAAKNGQGAAFGELCKRYAKRIFHITLRVTRITKMRKMHFRTPS